MTGFSEPISVRARPGAAAGRGLLFAEITRIPWVRSIAFAAASGGLLLLTAHTLLSGIATQNLHDWDESRHAVSAYEMSQRGDLLVNTWRGSPDYWNLKPPLSFWAIMAGYQVFGFTPLGLRAPSAAFTFGTGLLIWAWTTRRFGRAAGVIALAAFSSCNLLLNLHSGRTGDPDALFILAMTAGVVAGIEARSRPRMLVVAVIAFSLAFLTKSWHAGLLLVFIALLAFTPGLRGRLRGASLLPASLGLLPVLVWAGLRFRFDGLRFFDGMVQYDLLNRGSNAIEGHTGDGWYYLTLWFEQWGPWLAVGSATVCVVLSRSTRVSPHLTHWSDRRLTILALALWPALVLLAFSLAGTKLGWYATPGLPLVCALTGCSAASSFKGSSALRPVLVLALLLAFVQSQQLIAGLRHDEPAVAAQVALTKVPDDGRLHPVFLDPDAASWTQSMVATAEMSGGLAPRDGGLQAFEAAASSSTLPLMLIRRGSSTDKAVDEQPLRFRRIVQQDDLYLVRLNPKETLP
ncbi:ArnT family glycosyltransferase [Amnibacterium endophyticum]|uniref:ArnT family glycosyltransferase n=1 Tax=Amnibacterium endophyticum TaxID=2109337 RepID=A0ABW4LCQ6_9MICO